MKDVDSCFSFLQIPRRPPKPRSNGLTIVTDLSLSIQEARNFMETSAEVVDYVKFSDHAANIARHPRKWFEAKLDVYHSHGIKVFPGGIPFEVATLQGQVRPFMERLKDLGFDGVEISEDVIPPLAPQERISYVRMAKEIGLEAFTEIGKKDPTGPLDADDAIEAIQRDLEEGVKKVTVENSDLVLLMDSDPAPILKIVAAMGIEPLVFEVGPHGWPKTATWLIRSLGPEINLENLRPGQLFMVDAMRRGLNRNVNYEFLSVKGGRVE